MYIRNSTKHFLFEWLYTLLHLESNLSDNFGSRSCQNTLDCISARWEHLTKRKDSKAPLPFPQQSINIEVSWSLRMEFSPKPKSILLHQLLIDKTISAFSLKWRCTLSLHRIIPKDCSKLKKSYNIFSIKRILIQFPPFVEYFHACIF